MSSNAQHLQEMKIEDSKESVTVSDDSNSATKTKDQIIEKYKINGTTPINASELIEAERTEKNKQVGFQPGQSGNPKGRPKGSLNKIQSLFYDHLYKDWSQHGEHVIADMRIESPVKYAQLVASILPKSLQVENDGQRWVINAAPASMTSDEWLEHHNLKQINDLEHDDED